MVHHTSCGSIQWSADFIPSLNKFTEVTLRVSRGNFMNMTLASVGTLGMFVCVPGTWTRVSGQSDQDASG